MFQFVEFVENSRSEFLDVVVIEREVFEVGEMVEGCRSDGSDVVVAQRK